MDATVLNQFDQRLLGRFASHAVERRDHHDTGRIIDDDIDAGRLLECANVATLATDDAAFHLVARDVDRGDGRFGRVRRRIALDRHADDFASHSLGLLLQVGFLLQDQRAGFVLQFAFELSEQQVGRGLLVEAADFVELFLRLLGTLVEFLLFRIDDFVSLDQLLLSRFEHPLFLGDVVLLFL